MSLFMDRLYLFSQPYSVQVPEKQYSIVLWSIVAAECNWLLTLSKCEHLTSESHSNMSHIHQSHVVGGCCTGLHRQKVLAKKALFYVLQTKPLSILSVTHSRMQLGFLTVMQPTQTTVFKTLQGFLSNIFMHSLLTYTLLTKLFSLTLQTRMFSSTHLLFHFMNKLKHNVLVSLRATAQTDNHVWSEEAVVVCSPAYQ